jgi:hypothetical protein
MMTRKLLEQEGFEVDEAHDGAQARILLHLLIMQHPVPLPCTILQYLPSLSMLHGVPPVGSIGFPVQYWEE